MEYEFRNIKTKKIEYHSMSVSEYDQFKKDNPHLERYFESAPSFVYEGSKGFDARTDDTWKEVLSKIGEKHPVSNLADNYRKNKSK